MKQLLSKARQQQTLPIAAAAMEQGSYRRLDGPINFLISDRGSILASLPTAPVLILDVPEMYFDVAEIYSMALARGKCTEA